LVNDVSLPAASVSSPGTLANRQATTSDALLPYPPKKTYQKLHKKTGLTVRFL